MIKKIDKLILRNNLEKYLTKRYFNYFVIACFGLLGFCLNWNASMLIVGFALLWQILFPVKSQILAKIATFSLLLTPIMLIFRQNNKAEIFAVFAYLLLIISIFMTIFVEKERSGKKR